MEKLKACQGAYFPLPIPPKNISDVVSYSSCYSTFSFFKILCQQGSSFQYEKDTSAFAQKSEDKCKTTSALLCFLWRKGE